MPVFNNKAEREKERLHLNAREDARSPYELTKLS